MTLRIGGTLAWIVAGALQASACGPSAGAGEGDASAGESDATSTGDEPGTASCPAADPALALMIRSNTLVEEGELTDTPCNVVDVGTSDAGFELALDCTDRVSLFVDVTPPLVPALAVGDDVTLTVTVSGTGTDDVRRSLFIRDASSGALEVAAVSSSTAAWIDELAPLQLVPIADACESGPDEYDCLTGRRQMWNASVGGQTELVGAGQRSRIGAYDVHVQQAFVGQLLECNDIAGSEYRAVVVRTQ